MVLLAVGVLVTDVGRAEPAQAVTEFTTWRCAPAGCKYAQSRVKYDRQIRYWYSAEWKGGTASQACDPTNDVIQWRLLELKATSGTVYTWGPQGWKNNCSLLTYVVNVNRNWQGGLDVRFTFQHDAACSGCDFNSVTWAYG